ncbi:hypothetical protein GZ998_05355 [Actinomyces sp. 594]|uniref:hypothetical protein n=1 Tax=Actinomyces sp. 594 TaxID=2057793 RepID=UPI001C599C86|nr:hypothetical protein [Actinomyces sp. 594]MBW3068939.1 hypothetical protein [Actinomyces sp. 594]
MSTNDSDLRPYLPIPAPGLPLVHLARISPAGESDHHDPLTRAVVLCDHTRTYQLHGHAKGGTAAEMEALLARPDTCRACLLAYQQTPVPADNGGLLDLLEDQS